HDGTDPDLEELALPGDVGVGKETEHAPGERLDVGVVAVVDPADFSDALKEPPRRDAVFAEPGARHLERREVGMVSGHVDREPERDGRRTRVLLEDLHVDAGRARGADDGPWRLSASSKRGHA